MKIKLLLSMFLLSLGMNAQLTGSVDKVVSKSSEGVTTVYNDGKEAVKTAYTDSKGIVKYVTPKVESALKELGKSLKTGSSEVWKILVRQQRVYAWSYLAILVLAIFSWSHSYYRFSRMKKDRCEYNKLKDSNVAITIFCFILSLSLSATVAMTFQSMLTGFLNPEYGAMKTIVEVAKNL